MLLVFLSAGRGDAADWPMFRGDAARSGYTAEQLPEALWPLWTYRSAQSPRPAWPTRTRQRYDVAYQPVVVGGMLYFGTSAEGKLYGLDAATGRTRWQFFTDGPVRFAPAVWQDQLYAASDDGWLYCLDATSGKVQWKLRAGPRAEMVLGNDRLISRWPVRGGPVVADGTLYFGAGIWPSEGIFLYAVDANTGKVIWRNDSSGSIDMDQPHPTARAKSGIAVQGYLAVAGDALLVPTGRAVPAVFDRQTGTLRYFQLQSNGQVGGADVVAIDDYFFVGTSAFSCRDGASLGRVGTAVAAHPDFVVTSQGARLLGVGRRDPPIEKEVVDRKGQKKRIKTLPKPAWTAELPKDFGLVPPALKGTETPAGQLMKSTVWSTPVIAGEPGALVVAGNRAILGGRNKVLMIDMPSKTVLWTAEVDGAACGLAVADGRLYASTDRGMIHCFSGVRTAEPVVIGAPQNTSPQNTSESRKDNVYAAAEEILRRTGVTSGYCLDLACGDGRLALELARRTQLCIYGLEKDPEKVQASRKLLDAAGLYGTRVTIHQGDPSRANYPNYFADLVVSGRAVTEGSGAVPAAWFERMQRPCGGVACLGKPGALVQTSRGPLPGAGSWTHQNTDPANSFCSADTLVRGPLSMLWFRDTDFVMANRHGRAPAPLVDQGRMIVEGLHGLRAVSIYNGRTLWEFPLENVLLSYHGEHSIGAAWAGSNYCLGDDSVFVHDGRRCLRLEAASGRQTAEFPAPTRPDGKSGTWAYIACQGNLLFGTLADEEYLVRCWSHDWDTSGQFIESVMLFALDVQTGRTLWTFQPRNSIRNNAIAVGGGRVYLIDRPVAQVDDLRLPLAETKAEAQRRAAASGRTEEEEFRDVTPQPPGRLLALDSRTGKTLWATDREVFGTQLALSEKHGVLLMSYQPAHQASLHAERGDHMAALRSADGMRLWDVKADYVARPIINDHTIYAEPGAWELLSGKQIPFTLERSYGCGIPCGSQNLLLFRSATLAYIDLQRGSQTVNYGGIRPGCWIGAIPAGGLVLMPDAASWCTCSYLNQATIALEPQSGQ
jgi:outer membrane protein assembly factor BamB